MEKSEQTLEKPNSLYYGSFITSIAVLIVVAQNQSQALKISLIKIMILKKIAMSVS